MTTAKTIEKNWALFRRWNALFWAFSNTDMMLKINLSYQNLNVATNIYVSIAVFNHLWRYLFHIMSCNKGLVPYKGKPNIKCVILNQNMYLPKIICAFWGTRFLYGLPRVLNCHAHLPFNQVPKDLSILSVPSVPN